VPPRFWTKLRLDTAIFPVREALSADARLSTQVVHRWIEAKAALDSASDALRMELVHQGVDVTYIEPGALNTPFFVRSAANRNNRGYAGDTATQAAYSDAISRVSTAMSSSKPDSLNAVLKTIERALEARRPAPRYVVGRNAKAVTGIVRRLPTRTRDRAIMRTMDLRANAFPSS